MRVLVLHAHPVETSYNAALHRAVVEALVSAGHEVDDCDLHAEDFQPVLTRAERLGYHDTATNQAPVQSHVDRLQAAEALVMVFPVWNFGFPAILKGYPDRVFLPGVSFKLVDGKVVPALTNIKKLAVVTSYGAPRWFALLVGDPPRRYATRVLRFSMGFPKIRYLAHYDMNRATDRSRSAFLDRVTRLMKAF